MAPDYADVYFNKAELYALSEQPQEAIEVYGQCLKVNPKHIEARVLLHMPEILLQDQSDYYDVEHLKQGHRWNLQRYNNLELFA